MRIGTDIIEISRIERAIANFGDKFLRRVYSQREIDLYGKLLPSLAARFAAKEAVLKVLNAGGKGISFHDIEILSEPDGKPIVELHGTALKLARSQGIIDVAVSLSHSRDNAVAMAVGETAKPIVE